MPTRVLITGDRHWYCERLAARVVKGLLERHGNDIVIVQGAAPGVDTVFAEAAFEAGVTQEPHPARWDELGPKAGPIRNAEMVKLGAAFCIAFHRDLENSRGTLDCVSRCHNAGIPVWLVADEMGAPKRVWPPKHVRTVILDPRPEWERRG